MAEVAASIIGISTFGIKLTLTLYDFGCTTSSAKQQTDHIAKHVTLYSNVLELLAERLEADAPIISEAAIDLVEELYEQSEELFNRIRALLPRKDGRDEISFLQKIAWNFKKTKIDLLVGELEYLKSSTQLLVAVIFTGRRIRSYRERRGKVGKEEARKERQAMDAQCRKAQVVIVEQTIAAEQLPTLQKEDDRSEALAVEGGSNPRASSTSAITLVARQTDAIARFQGSLTSIQDASQRQALVLQHSTQLLHELLQQWTHLDQPEEISASTSAVLSNNLSTDGNDKAPKVKGRQEDQPSVNTAQSDGIPADWGEELQDRADPGETQQVTAYLHAQAGRVEQPAAATQRLPSRYASHSGEKTDLYEPGSGLDRPASVRNSAVDPKYGPRLSPSRLSQTQQVPPRRHRSLSLSPKFREAFGLREASFTSSSSDVSASNVRVTLPRTRPMARPRAPRAGATKHDGLEVHFPSSRYAKVHVEGHHTGPRYTQRENAHPSIGQDESRYRAAQSKPPRRRKSGKTEQSSVPLIAHAANLAGIAAVLGMTRRNLYEARKGNEAKTSTETKKSRSRPKRTPYVQNRSSWDSDTYDSYYDSEESLQGK